MDSKVNSRSYSTVETTAKVDEVAILESNTRQLLREFVDNSGENELSLDPMEKPSRFIVCVQLVLYGMNECTHDPVLSFHTGMRLLKSSKR